MHTLAIIIFCLELFWAGFIIGFLLAVWLIEKPKPRRRPYRRKTVDFVWGGHHFVAVWHRPQDRKRAVAEMFAMCRRVAEEVNNEKCLEK